ncbi:diguanylate cyclase domain-containing protein [Luteibacter sp.]|uniref:sensor domain-containing protein n=1 Tax=Luteibacter sp. TaxID=1886636 RepID=UPI003F8138DF
MPQERHARLTRLVDRSSKASVALVVLLTLAGVGTALGLLATQRIVGKRYEVLIATQAIAQDVHDMRVAVGAWVIRDDRNAAAAWHQAVDSANDHIAMLQASLGSDGRERNLVTTLAGSVRERIDTAAPLLARPAAADRSRRIEELMGGDYQSRNDAVSRDVLALANYERDRLQRGQFRQAMVLSIAGAALIALVAWSVVTLRRSRRMARSLLDAWRDSLDATQRGRAELQAFTDAAPLAVFHVDAMGVPLWQNAQAHAFVGTRAGVDVATFMRENIEASDQARVLDAWRQLVTTGERFEQVFRFRGTDGLNIWAHAHATPVVVAGTTSGFVAVLQDITGARMLQEELDQSRKRLRRLTDSIPALIGRLDDSETYRFANDTYRNWFGDAAPRIGQTLREFVGDANYQRLVPMLARVRNGQTVRFEMNQMKLHGKYFTGDVTYTPEIDDAGVFRGFYVMVTDVSERKKLEESLFAAKELAQVTLDSIGDAVLTTDTTGTITFLNQRAEALLLRPAMRARGMPIESVVYLRDSSDQPSESSLMRAIAEERPVDMLQPRQLLLADGTRLDIEDVAAPIRDREGHVVGGVLVLRDVSVARAVADRMRQLAESDTLTGLPNRLVFEERLKASLAHLKADDSLAVLYMDLDGFKAVNDIHGHAAGDELLRQFAERLLRRTRKADTVCRLGGDEFVALLAPPISLREAMVRAEDFVDAAAQPFFWNGVPLHVTVSVGIATAPQHGVDALALVRHADDALYEAKASGKNKVAVL